MKRNMSGNGNKVLVIRIVCAILCDHFMEIIVVRIYPLDGGGSINLVFLCSSATKTLHLLGLGTHPHPHPPFSNNSVSPAFFFFSCLWWHLTTCKHLPCQFQKAFSHKGSPREKAVIWQVPWILHNHCNLYSWPTLNTHDLTASCGQFQWSSPSSPEAQGRPNALTCQSSLSKEK